MGARIRRKNKKKLLVIVQKNLLESFFLKTIHLQNSILIRKASPESNMICSLYERHSKNKLSS